MFKVVPDQLRISEGWVRCGQCEEIFDASAHMQEDLPPPASPEPASVKEEAPAWAQVPAEPHMRDTQDAPAPGDATPPPAELDLELLEPVPAASSPLPDDSADGRTEPVLSTEMAAPPDVSDPEPVTAASPAPTPTPPLSFMRGARKRSRWHHPLVRASLMVLGLLLFTGLLLQLLVHERNRIAAMHPGLRPVVEEVCLLAGCDIRPLRQIESVVIDSSSFSKIKGDVYRLSLTLKNNAPIDLAMPSIELALTDALDHPLLRRVFAPAELGAGSSVIAATSETQATLVLTVKANGNGERIAGYRLLAFYP